MKNTFQVNTFIYSNLKYTFLDVNFKTVLNDLRSMISNIKYDKQVLCHNDLLINNLLYDSEQGEKFLINF
jgi:thiamine kinase-like enzyme